MGFVKSLEEIAKNYRETGEFYDAEVLTLLWETKPQIVARLLPLPLKPAAQPLVLAFLANYPRTSFGVSYLEGALFLRAQFNGEEGNYCLSMPVTNDMAMALGREIYGYPKKIGQIHLSRSRDKVEGWAERHGVRFCEMRASLTGKFNADDAQKVVAGILGSTPKPTVIVYNFKHFPSPQGGGFDYSPRLIREEVELGPTSIQLGQGEIVLRPSDYDPWAEVEVVRMLGAMYAIGNNSMKRGSVVAEVDPMQFAPYAFSKWDV